MHKAGRIARYSLSLKPESLSPEAAHEVKRRIIDSVGCALGAWRTPVARSAMAVAGSARPAGEPAAQLIGLADGSLLEWAAFANGSLVRALDFNDTYLSLEPAHPSDNIAAMIAAAQAHGRSGKDLLLAIAIAYEIQCRLCDGASLRKHGVDHVTYGAFSSAAGGGFLAGLTGEEMGHALGIAGVCNITTRQTRSGEMSAWKACAFANAARNGLFAVRCAKAGMTGPAPIFEGARGLESVFLGPFELELPADGIAPRMICDTYIKPFPVEYHAQSAVEAAIRLHDAGLTIDQIQSVTIDTHGAAYQIIGSEPEKWDPTTRETADHSLPYCTAIALRDGTVTDESFEEKNYRDSGMLKFLKRVAVVEDAAYTEDYPRSFANRLTIKTRDGRTLKEEALHPLGHPKNPMSDARLEQKFRGMAEGLMSEADQRGFLDRVWALEKASDLGGLLPRLSVKPGEGA